MGISNFPSTFQRNLCHIIWTRKVPKKYPQQLRHFLKVGDGFSYEKNSINQKIYIKECSPHQY
jgi:hypothetical protein